MFKNQYTSIEEAQEAFDAVPSYVQRYQDNPNLYPLEEVFTLVAVVDITDIYVDAAHVEAEAVKRG